MKDLQENIVPVENQNAGDFYVHKEGGGVRVMFVGNSITKHAPKPQIGWTNDCGMAASSIDKDYVHILERRIGEIDKDAAFGLLQVAHFEHEFADMDPAVYYSQQIKFKPDVVIMFFGANVSKEYDVCENPKRKFGEAFEALRNALDTGNTFFLISDGFYIRPVLDAEKKKGRRKVWRRLCRSYRYKGKGGLSRKVQPSGRPRNGNDSRPLLGDIKARDRKKEPRAETTGSRNLPIKRACHKKVTGSFFSI